MAPQTSSIDDQENVDFLLTVVMTAETFKPDFEAAAAKFGIKDSHNAQRKFKAIAEKSKKYECKKNVITEKPNQPVAAQTAIAVAATPTPTSSAPKSKTPKKRTTSSANRGATKRNKIEEEVADNQDASETNEDFDED